MPDCENEGRVLIPTEAFHTSVLPQLLHAALSSNVKFQVARMFVLSENMEIKLYVMCSAYALCPTLSVMLCHADAQESVKKLTNMN